MYNIRNLFVPVARRPVYDHECDEDAEEEEDEHGVLHELDVVRVVETLKMSARYRILWNRIHLHLTIIHDV